MDKKILYLGTPNISAIVLEGIIKAGFNVVALISQPRHNKNRKGELLMTPTEEVARKYGIPVYQPEKLNKEYEFLNDIDFDVMLTMAYGQLISTKVLEMSKYPPLNLHGSILPKYRGASPIQAAIRNGEKETGITLMQMVKGMDAGDMFAKIYVPIDGGDTFDSLSIKLATASIKLIKEKLPLFFENKLIPEKQKEEDVTFCSLITKDEEKINFNSNAKSIVNLIHSLSSNPGAYCYLDDLVIKVYKAHYELKDIEGMNGEIIVAHKDEIGVKVKDGVVFFDLLQKQGKKILTSREFNNGEKLCGKIVK